MELSSLNSPSCPQYGPNHSRNSLQETWKEIEDVKDQIRVVLEEIERANASLRKLRSIEKVLLGVAAEKGRSLSPFARLPRDIIGDIASHLTGLGNEISRISGGIWPLTYVCTSWRDTILSLPYLWSSFSIYMRHPPLEMLSTILRRSASHPLSFGISYLTQSAHPTAAMSLLVDHSERWKSARIDTRFGPALFLRLHRRLPLLEYLGLDLVQPEGDRRWHDTEAEQRIFEDIPNLTKLELSSPYRGSFPVRLRFPVEQLYAFRNGLNTRGDAARFLNIDELRSFSHLRSMDLSLAGPHSPSMTLERLWDRRLIKLPNLTHLRLSHSLQLLQPFVLPSITSLEFRSVCMDTHSLAISRTFFDSIPRGQLKSLSIRLSENDESNNVEALLSNSALDHIHTLTLAQYWDILCPSSWVISFLSRSTYSTSRHQTLDRIPLAHLRSFTLYFGCQAGDQEIFRTLLAFVASRTSLVDELVTHGSGNELVPARLEALCYTYHDLFQPITLDNIHNLEAGLGEFRFDHI